MVFKLSDARLDSWFQITADIKRGKHPEDKWLLEALRRGDADIPKEAQAYIANRIEGKIDRRGRPRKDKMAQRLEAEILIMQVDACKNDFSSKYTNPKQKAYELIAKSRGWSSPEVAKRNYQKAKTLLKTQSD